MSRRKNLGNLGEQWTDRLLKSAGFRSVRDLNSVRYNHPGGDFIAKRKGKLYFITVKSRNKFVQDTRRLNSGYNIYPDKVRRAAREYDAIPACPETDYLFFLQWTQSTAAFRRMNSSAISRTRLTMVSTMTSMAGSMVDISW